MENNGPTWKRSMLAVLCGTQFTFRFLFLPKGSAEFLEWQNKNYVHRLKNCGIKKYEPKRQKKETFFCLQWKIKDSWKKFYEQLHWNMKGKSRSNFEFMPPFSHYRQCVEQKKKKTLSRKSHQNRCTKKWFHSNSFKKTVIIKNRVSDACSCLHCSKFILTPHMNDFICWQQCYAAFNTNMLWPNVGFFSDDLFFYLLLCIQN